MPLGVEDPDSLCVVELPGLLLDQAGPRVDLLRCRVVCASKPARGQNPVGPVAATQAEALDRDGVPS